MSNWAFGEAAAVNGADVKENNARHAGSAAQRRLGPRASYQHRLAPESAYIARNILD